MTLREQCVQAKKASFILACADGKTRSEALLKMAEALDSGRDKIIAANKKDLASADENGLALPMIERLTLNGKRIDSMIESVKSVALLPDPLGTAAEYTRPNGLKIEKRAVPFGLIAIIYESRPNVTADAAAMCIMSGNAVILRGGREAINSNIAIADILSEALKRAGLPGECVSIVRDTSRQTAGELMTMNGVVDLLIPRGGKALITSAVENATVPVIETGAGNCHIYIDEYADAEKAVKITENAKRSRPSVCNAAESLIIARCRAKELLPLIKNAMPDVELRGDEEVLKILPDIKPADDSDYYAEYNDLVMSVHIVSDVCEAVEHINSHSTRHSECIVTENAQNAEYFLNNIDSAAVYHNASTRFTDGGEFGFGSEIGISTQKLHARGPMGLKEMTTYKYVIRGNGQIR